MRCKAYLVLAGLLPAVLALTSAAATAGPAAGLTLAAAAGMKPPPPSQFPHITFCTGVFKYTGAEQSCIVGNVTRLTLIAVGGKGGTAECSLASWASATETSCANAAAGGHGGYVTATISVHPLEVLYIEVGGNGGSPGYPPILPGTGHAGGWNGGGNGAESYFSQDSGGGGGATDVRTVSCEPYCGGSLFNLASRASRLVVAGGGGGGGSGGDAGSGDSTVAEVLGLAPPPEASTKGGDGGDAGASGGDATISSSAGDLCGPGGSGAGPSYSGVGGWSVDSWNSGPYPGTDGSWALGGNGGADQFPYWDYPDSIELPALYAGGGGGGGYYGGGGGAGGEVGGSTQGEFASGYDVCGGGGGGGGSSFGPAGSRITVDYSDYGPQVRFATP